LFDFHFDEDVSILRQWFGWWSLVNASMVERMSPNCGKPSSRINSAHWKSAIQVYYQRVEKMLAAKASCHIAHGRLNPPTKKLGDGLVQIELKKCPRTNQSSFISCRQFGLKIKK